MRKKHFVHISDTVIISFQVTVKNVGDVFLRHSVQLLHHDYNMTIDSL